MKKIKAEKTAASLKCRYCNADIDPHGSMGTERATGEHYHIDCFVEHAPNAKEIVKEALLRANAAFRRERALVANKGGKKKRLH